MVFELGQLLVLPHALNLGRCELPLYVRFRIKYFHATNPPFFGLGFVDEEFVSFKEASECWSKHLADMFLTLYRARSVEGSAQFAYWNPSLQTVFDETAHRLK